MRIRAAVSLLQDRPRRWAIATATGAALCSGGTPPARAQTGRTLEAHVWAHDGQVGPLEAASSDDFWTSSGTHYRFDGTSLGKLSFSDQLGGSPREIVAVRAGSHGQAFVLGVWSSAGWGLSAHDPRGKQLWLRPLGRAAPKDAAKSPVRRRSQSEPKWEVSVAELLGVSEAGDVTVSGWVQGCVDLAPAPASQVECALLERAGRNADSNVDAFPQIFFTTRFDKSGAWKRSRVYPRLPARAAAWSGDGDRLAVTLSGWWKKTLTFQAPDGTTGSVTFGPDDPAQRSVVVLFDGAGHLAGAFHLLARTGQSIRDMTFDRAGKLWLLAASSPGPEMRGPGTQHSGASAVSCLSVVSIGVRNEPPYFHGTSCVPGTSADLAGAIDVAADGRVIIGGAPSGLADGETLEQPTGLEAAPAPPRDVCGNVARDYRQTRVAVTRAGNPDWSVPVPTVFAIGLASGWTCLATNKHLACVRPGSRRAGSAPAPSGPKPNTSPAN